jgi:hypothetical protein
MRLKEYARPPQQRKASVQPPGLLLVGVDVSHATHHACLGTPRGITCRKLVFPQSREGCRRFAQPLRDPRVKHSCRRLLSAMEPSGLSGQGLSDRLRSCGDAVCLVSGHAGHNHRQTMPETPRKTEEKAAYSVLDVLRQGKFFLPVARDAELQAADRLLHRHMAWKKRVRQLRNPLRAAIHLTFPALHPMSTDLTQPPAFRVLPAPPTPAALLRHGRQRFLDAWPPRQRGGQWRPQKWPPLYELAPHRLGRIDPYRLDECAIPTVAHDLADALATQPRWLDHAMALLAPRPDCPLLRQWPRSGAPTAAAILTAIGAIRQ